MGGQEFPLHRPADSRPSLAQDGHRRASDLCESALSIERKLDGLLKPFISLTVHGSRRREELQYELQANLDASKVPPHPPISPTHP
jgi:hypothetical protein